MDETDHQLIALLRHDARLSVAALIFLLQRAPAPSAPEPSR